MGKNEMNWPEVNNNKYEQSDYMNWINVWNWLTDTVSNVNKKKKKKKMHSSSGIYLNLFLLI